MVRVVVGIDPSVRATGIAVVLENWGGDWSKVLTSVVKGGPAKKGDLEGRIGRNGRIARDICSEIHELEAQLTGPGVSRVTHVFIENYSFGSSFNAHHLGELGGAIRNELLKHFDVTEVAIPTARKLLLGKVPKVGAKVAVYDAVMAAFGTSGRLSLDEADAFCIANYGLSELGAFCLVGGTEECS